MTQPDMNPLLRKITKKARTTPNLNGLYLKWLCQLFVLAWERMDVTEYGCREKGLCGHWGTLNGQDHENFEGTWMGSTKTAMSIFRACLGRFGHCQIWVHWDCTKNSRDFTKTDAVWMDYTKNEINMCSPCVFGKVRTAIHLEDITENTTKTKIRCGPYQKMSSTYYKPR